MISSELPEVLRLADRILVMREGRLVAEFDHTGRFRGDDRRRGDRPGGSGGRMTIDAAVAESRRTHAGSSTSSSGSASSGSSRCSALLVLVTAVIQPRFLSAQELQFILVDTTIFALLAVGETMVVLTRNVDLSVGSVLGLSAFLSADLFGKHPGHPDRARLRRRDRRSASRAGSRTGS